MSELKLPSEFVRRIQEVHGKQGKTWLTRIPELLAKYSKEWDFQVHRVLPNLSYNLVLAGDHATEGKVILKSGIPSPELESEASALLWYNGNGCVKLLKSSKPDGVMLLEKADPGETLATLAGDKDLESVLICCKVIQQLHSNTITTELEESFQGLEDRLSNFSRLKAQSKEGKAPFDLSLLERAERIYSDLISTTSTKVLLHGDLHHSNILLSGRSPWLAIDPHALIGDPAFEVAAFMRNPFPGIMSERRVRDLLSMRIKIFSEKLGFDQERVWGWSFAQTTLASGWIFEDHGHGWEEWYELAKIFLELEPK